MLRRGCLLALALAAAPVSIASAGQPVSSPYNDYEIACEAGELIVRPISPHVAEQGPATDDTVDCLSPHSSEPLRVRFDANQAFPYGQCGGAPSEYISLWVNRRRVISRRFIGDGCNGLKLAKLEATASSVLFCSYIGQDPKTHQDVLDERAASAGAGLVLPQTAEQATAYHQICEIVPFNLTTPIDHIEYPSGTEKPPTPGTLQSNRADDHNLCGAVLSADRTKLVAPPDSESPAWLDWKPTTYCGHTRRASFDFANEGVVRDVYDWDMCSHASDGDVYLTLPAGAPEPKSDLGEDPTSWTALPPDARLWALGYAHAEVFRQRGKTYLLETPVNEAEDYYLRRPELDGSLATVCSWHRVHRHM